jgi:hypothetical protein
MKCRQIIKKFGHLKREELPTDIRALVESDAEAREWFIHAERQRNLLQLKAHERPAPEVHGRVVYQVRTRIEAGERLATPELGTPRSTLILQMTTVAVILAAGTVVYINSRAMESLREDTHLVIEEHVPAKAQTPIEALFKPIPTHSTNELADTTNSFPMLAPSKPGQSGTQRVVGPASE